LQYEHISSRAKATEANAVTMMTRHKNKQSFFFMITLLQLFDIAAVVTARRNRTKLDAI